jgi:hypothetical protein
MDSMTKRTFTHAAAALAAVLLGISPASAWSCSNEEPLSTPLPAEERARVAAQVERERAAATAQSRGEMAPRTATSPRPPFPPAGILAPSPSRTLQQ